MEFRVQQVNGVNHIFMKERKKKVVKIHHIQTIENANNGGHKISIPLAFSREPSIQTYISDTNDTSIILVLLFDICRSIKNCIHGVFHYSKDGLKPIHVY
jgi:hypothetical protein